MMMHPSYQELMKTINNDSVNEEDPIVRSRYSVVLATSKRARQITEGAEPYVTENTGKALSIAVKEFSEGKVKIVPKTDEPEAEEADDFIIEDDEPEEIAEAPAEEPAAEA